MLNKLRYYPVFIVGWLSARSRKDSTWRKKHQPTYTKYLSELRYPHVNNHSKYHTLWIMPTDFLFKKDKVWYSNDLESDISEAFCAEGPS